MDLRTYFTQLCSSLGASMIEDPSKLSIEVSVDDALTSSDTSVSLGLIVTELVIQFHQACLSRRSHGKDQVEYRAHGPNWTLSVSDDGIGMPLDPALSKPGLGTSIVEAFASQLEAEVQVRDSRPGTTVAIVHARIAAVHQDVQASAR